MFQFAGFASHGYGFTVGSPRREGLPHSDISGSTSARLSPELFAACHVLHRLSVPRHPPNALLLARSRSAPSACHTSRERRVPHPRNQASSLACRDLGLGISIPMPGHDRSTAPDPIQTEDRISLRSLLSRPLHGHDSLHDVKITGPAQGADPSLVPVSRPLPTACRTCPARHTRRSRGARRAWWAWADLNGRPHAYQACALTS